MKFVKILVLAQYRCLHTILLAVHTPLITSSLKKMHPEFFSVARKKLIMVNAIFLNFPKSITYFI